MLLRKNGSDIILKTMTSNKHDFVRIRGVDSRVFHYSRKTRGKNNNEDIFQDARRLRDEQLAERGVLTWNASGFIITGAPTRFDDNHITLSGKKIIRVAFVASKKGISKLAVHRNLAKRKMRAVVNDFVRGNLPENYDYIFIAKKGIFDLSYKKMSEQFIWACEHFRRMVAGEKFPRKKLDHDVAQIKVDAGSVG